MTRSLLFVVTLLTGGYGSAERTLALHDWDEVARWKRASCRRISERLRGNRADLDLPAVRSCRSLVVPSAYPAGASQVVDFMQGGW